MGKGMSLIEFFLENKNIQSWNEHLSLKQRQLLLGLSGSAKSLAIASSAKNQNKILVMTSTYGEAERLVNDLISILGTDMVYPFLVDDSPMVEFLVSSQEKIFSRVEALRARASASGHSVQARLSKCSLIAIYSAKSSSHDWFS